MRIKEITQKQQLCLLYGAKNEKYNQAVVLKAALENIKKYEFKRKRLIEKTGINF